MTFFPLPCDECGAGCNCVITALDTPTVDITITGSGSTGDPFVISAEATAGGGGTTLDEFLQIAASPPGGEPISNGVYEAVVLDPTAFGGGAFVTRGTDITWSAVDPTRVTINATGVYDVQVLGVFNPGTDPAQVVTFYYVNGASSFIEAAWPVPGFSDPANTNHVGVATTTVQGRAFTAGDYIEVMVVQSGNASDDTSLAYAIISVVRRV